MPEWVFDDAAIVATAAHLGRTLVTRNIRDFEQLGLHLTLEFYTQQQFPF